LTTLEDALKLVDPPLSPQATARILNAGKAPPPRKRPPLVTAASLARTLFEANPNMNRSKIVGVAQACGLGSGEYTYMLYRAEKRNGGGDYHGAACHRCGNTLRRYNGHCVSCVGPG